MPVRVSSSKLLSSSNTCTSLRAPRTLVRSKGGEVYLDQAHFNEMRSLKSTQTTSLNFTLSGRMPFNWCGPFESEGPVHSYYYPKFTAEYLPGQGSEDLFLYLPLTECSIILFESLEKQDIKYSLCLLNQWTYTPGSQLAAWTKHSRGRHEKGSTELLRICLCTTNNSVQLWKLTVLGVNLLLLLFMCLRH